MLSLLRVLCIAAVALNFPSTNFAQQMQSDPTAITIATRSLTAMGAAAPTTLVDSRAVGVLTMYFDSPVQMPITLESEGLTRTRVALQQPTGTSIRVLNSGQAAFQNPDGTVRQLTEVNLFAERVGHIPAMSLLTEIQNPAALVEFVSSAQANGTPDNVIAVSLGQSTIPGQADIQKSISRTLFYINQASGLVDRVQYTRFSEAPHPGIPIQVEQSFSDYRNVGGNLVPFHNTTRCDGIIESDLQLNSISFNVGVPASDFTLPASQQ
ncbi:MAG: hypothetical protein ACRD5M_11265 [Candidatus Acidiferrales bacterium]